MSKSIFHIQNILFGISVAFLAFSCKPATTTTEETTKAEESTPAAMKYTVTPFGSSEEFPDARLDAMEYKDGQVKFTVSGYELGVQTTDAPSRGCANSGKGQHIHFIVDNQPYAAKYESTFDYDIPDGEHYILAFLSRSYHESIKSPEAAVAVKATIKDKSITEATPISTPMLFYSRPKGVYEGDDTKRILLDYYLVKPDPSYKVKATINGEDHMLDKWQPYVITGLPAGENTITLTLVDASGNKVDAPLNPVTRQFMLNPTPPQN